MANIKPFRGIRYETALIKDMSTVVSQPYDRVRHGLQSRYYALSEHNITRIIKGKEFAGDDENNNVYTRARGYLTKWLQTGILIREELPAIYVYHQQFTLPNGKLVTRKALVSALELTTFDEGVVLPHERTHSGPKVDRLNLVRATETYFGNILMLYPDPKNRINALLAPAIEREPDVDLCEMHEKDVRQMVWVVTDPEVIDGIVVEMEPRRNLIIADGHHRYETALNYRKEQRTRFPDAPANAGFNYRLATLVSMSDPGLTILPTNRLIFGYDKLSSQEVLERASAFFSIEQVAGRPALEARMAEALGDTGRIGLETDGGTYLLTLDDLSAMDKLAPDRTSAWKSLDVSILHELLLEQVLGLSKGSIERLEHITYLREPDLGYEQVASGEAQFLFLLNPTRMEQVEACTAAGEKMPQKSTDFFPKVITGLTMLPVGSEERL